MSYQTKPYSPTVAISLDELFKHFSAKKHVHIQLLKYCMPCLYPLPELSLIKACCIPAIALDINEIHYIRVTGHFNRRTYKCRI